MAGTDDININELKMRRLQAHLAEYNALTTRLTYWITLQYVTYALAAAFLGVIAQAWGRVDAVKLAWASILTVLLILWALLQTNFEISTYVVYIERCLRPKVSPLTESVSFWRFERLIARIRRNPFISFEQRFGLAPLFVGGIVAAGWIIISSARHNWCSLWTLSNCVWFGCNVYVATMTYLRFRYVRMLQKGNRSTVYRQADASPLMPN